MTLSSNPPSNEPLVHGRPAPDPTWWTRLGAVFEVVGVLLAAILLGRAVGAALGIEPWKPTQAAMLEAGNPDFWKLAWLATVEQVLKYGIAFALFYALGRWHRDRRLPAYGLRLGERGLGRLIAIGVVSWAAFGVLPYSLQTAAALFPALGSGPEHWNLFPSTWTLGFLVYMAASSFALVPLVEELYARGYMVTRLAEDYGAAGGVALSALFFALAHTQYFQLEVLSLGMLVSLVVSSLGAGYVFLKTGSLVPVIVAHALVNVPTPPVAWAQPAILALMLGVLVVARRPLFVWLGDALRLLRTISWGATALGGLALVASLALATSGALPTAAVAAALVALAVIANAANRRA